MGFRFEVGQKYTIFIIDSAMAMTHRREFEVTGEQVNKLDPSVMDAVIKPRGKRKEYIYPVKTRSYQSAPIVATDDAVFAGWDIPIACDTVGGKVMRGNALYNFTGAKPEVVRAYIAQYQLNPNFEQYKSVFVHDTTKEGELILFPELYTAGNYSHAVIDRMLAVEVDG